MSALICGRVGSCVKSPHENLIAPRCCGTILPCFYHPRRRIQPDKLDSKQILQQHLVGCVIENKEQSAKFVCDMQMSTNVFLRLLNKDFKASHTLGSINQYSLVEKKVRSNLQLTLELCWLKNGLQCQGFRWNENNTLLHVGILKDSIDQCQSAGQNSSRVSNWQPFMPPGQRRCLCLSCYQACAVCKKLQLVYFFAHKLLCWKNCMRWASLYVLLRMAINASLSNLIMNCLMKIILGYAKINKWILVFIHCAGKKMENKLENWIMQNFYLKLALITEAKIWFWFDF